MTKLQKDSEPVGEIVEAHGLVGVSIPEMPPVGTKLYTEPPNRVWMGLTDQDMKTMFLNDVKTPLLADFARAIEAKLREKNT